MPDRTAEAGFVVEQEGRLAEMLQVVGIKKADAELVTLHRNFLCLVAGARNLLCRSSVSADIPRY